VREPSAQGAWYEQCNTVCAWGLDQRSGLCRDIVQSAENEG
jgi:hypothetical protein